MADHDTCAVRDALVSVVWSIEVLIHTQYCLNSLAKHNSHAVGVQNALVANDGTDHRFYCTTQIFYFWTSDDLKQIEILLTGVKANLDCFDLHFRFENACTLCHYLVSA